MKIKSGTKYFIMIVVVSIIGIASRKLSDQLPFFIAKYAGDTMWTTAFYFFFRIIFRRFSAYKIAILTFLFSILIETSQLYHAIWIDKIRNTLLGGLLLGFGFLWSDLICYFAGIIIGLGIDKLFIKRS